MAMPHRSIESTTPRPNGRVDVKLPHDAGRREADREQIESVERVEKDGDRADDDLKPTHR